MEETRQKWPTRRLGGQMSRPELITNITTELHPGALRYYEKKRDRDKGVAITWCAARAFPRRPAPTQSQDLPTWTKPSRERMLRFLDRGFAIALVAYSLGTGCSQRSGAEPYQAGRCIWSLYSPFALILTQARPCGGSRGVSLQPLGIAASALVAFNSNCARGPNMDLSRGNFQLAVAVTLLLGGG